MSAETVVSPVRTEPEDLPTRPGAVHHVLAVADDPDAGVTDLARAIAVDPALTASMLRLANSSYYGLTARIGRVDLAVAVLGFTTVRTVALLSAVGTEGDVPAGFWDHAAVTATAAGLCAPLLDVDASDAFCLGLLHCVGALLLHRVRELPALCLPEPADIDALRAREVKRYGVAHDTIGAQTLRAWNFPATLCDLIGAHHDTSRRDPLARVLATARLCTNLAAVDAPASPDDLARVETASSGRVPAEDVGRWTRQVQRRSADLLQVLQLL
ncbi:MAG: HDOD domain-containing protein [Jatrophihabitans sp.]|uniref:HDOD domain-containing protein n=1 Tax=Jatrophihabitans sp. TaxID=1932789 RepID=UPI003F801508